MLVGQYQQVGAAFFKSQILLIMPAIELLQVVCSQEWMSHLVSQAALLNSVGPQGFNIRWGSRIYRAEMGRNDIISGELRKDLWIHKGRHSERYHSIWFISCRSLSESNSLINKQSTARETFMHHRGEFGNHPQFKTRDSTETLIPRQRFGDGHLGDAFPGWVSFTFKERVAGLLRWRNFESGSLMAESLA